MKAYDLGERGLPLLHKFLDEGDKLALALKKQDLSLGRVLTFIPDAAGLDKISLTEGGLGHFDWDEDFCSSITRLVEGYLERPQSWFVMELETTSREFAQPLFKEKPYTASFFEGSSHVMGKGRDSSADDTVGVYGYIRGRMQSASTIAELIATVVLSQRSVPSPHLETVFLRVRCHIVGRTPLRSLERMQSISLLAHTTMKAGLFGQRQYLTGFE